MKKKFFKDDNFTMYMLIIAAFLAICIIAALISKKQNNDHFAEAQEKAKLSYTIYMDGKRMDQNEFNVNSLDAQKYRVRFNDGAEEIYLNRK